MLLLWRNSRNNEGQIIFLFVWRTDKTFCKTIIIMQCIPYHFSLRRDAYLLWVHVCWGAFFLTGIVPLHLLHANHVPKLRKVIAEKKIYIFNSVIWWRDKRDRFILFKRGRFPLTRPISCLVTRVGKHDPRHHGFAPFSKTILHESW